MCGTSVNITQRWSEMSEQRCVKKNAGPKGSDQRLCYLTSVQVYRTSVKVKQTLVRLLGLTFGNTNAGQPTPDQRFSSRHGLRLTVRRLRVKRHTVFGLCRAFFYLATRPSEAASRWTRLAAIE